MKSEKMKIFNIIIALIFTLNVGAQDSLDYYLLQAARNNPGVQQKYQEYLAALQKVPQAGGLPDPQLNLGVFLSPMELVSGNQLADIQLMQMFPWFGTLRAAKDEMSLMANARFETFRDSKLQLFYDVQSTWFELFKIQQEISVSNRNLDLLRTIERLSLVKFTTAPAGRSGALPSNGIQPGSSRETSKSSSGMSSMGGNSPAKGVGATMEIPSSMQGSAMGSSAGSSGLADLYQVQMEIGDLENNIFLLISQQNTIMAKFNSFLNRPPLTPVFLPDTLKPDTLGFPLKIVEDSMLSRHPMLGMLDYEKQSLESRKKMVSRMSYPMIGLGLNYSVINKTEMSTSEMNGKDMIMPMVSVSLPIYRKKYRAMRLEADYLKTAAEQNYIAVANNLKTDYYQAVQQFEDARRRVKLFTNQSLLAQKSLDIMIRNFAASGSGLTEILRLRQQTLDYNYKQVEAVADCNTAVAWLKRLMASQQNL
jgi:outer membrane protein TolC